jgi:glyoxylase-like metal-dependent hydrolase (beta-lactamase superfamily II)
MRRIRAEPGAAQRELRNFDARNYVERKPLSLGKTQSLPVPGKLEIGEEEFELHAADGHTRDGMLVFAPWIGVLVCGDYNSGVEIPWISSGGSIADYRSTLSTLSGLIERATSIVPGHGSPHDRERGLRLIDEDVAYLDALETGHERPALPQGRDSKFQRWIHAENLKQL